jgi:hypothetical protein
MLWPYSQVKEGLNLFYKNNLWIFDDEEPKLFGVTDDGWATDDKDAFVICPNGSRSLQISLWSPEEWGKSSIKIDSGDSSSEYQIDGKLQEVKFSGSYSVLRMSSKGHQYHSSLSDGRHLVAHLRGITCY